MASHFGRQSRRGLPQAAKRARIEHCSTPSKAGRRHHSRVCHIGRKQDEACPRRRDFSSQGQEPAVRVARSIRLGNRQAGGRGSVSSQVVRLTGPRPGAEMSRNCRVGPAFGMNRHCRGHDAAFALGTVDLGQSARCDEHRDAVVQQVPRDRHMQGRHHSGQASATALRAAVRIGSGRMETLGNRGRHSCRPHFAWLSNAARRPARFRAILPWRAGPLRRPRGSPLYGRSRNNYWASRRSA